MRCLIGLHERSRGQARYDEQARAYVSRCRRCGKPMRKSDGAWIVDRAAAEELG